MSNTNLLKSGNHVFPFNYNGINQYSCINNKEGYPLCSTSVDPKTKKWLTYGFFPKEYDITEDDIVGAGSGDSNIENNDETNPRPDEDSKSEDFSESVMETGVNNITQLDTIRNELSNISENEEDESNENTIPPPSQTKAKNTTTIQNIKRRQTQRESLLKKEEKIPNPTLYLKKIKVGDVFGIIIEQIKSQDFEKAFLFMILKAEEISGGIILGSITHIEGDYHMHSFMTDAYLYDNLRSQKYQLLINIKNATISPGRKIISAQKPTMCMDIYKQLHRKFQTFDQSEQKEIELQQINVNPKYQFREEYYTYIFVDDETPSNLITETLDKLEDVVEDTYKIRIIRHKKQTFQMNKYNAWYSPLFHDINNTKTSFKFKTNIGLLANTAVYDDIIENGDRIDLIFIDLINFDEFNIENDLFDNTKIKERKQGFFISNDYQKCRINANVFHDINGFSNQLFECVLPYLTLLDRISGVDKRSRNAQIDLFGFQTRRINGLLREYYYVNRNRDGLLQNDLSVISRENQIDENTTLNDITFVSSATPAIYPIMYFLKSNEINLQSELSRNGKLTDDDSMMILQFLYPYLDFVILEGMLKNIGKDEGDELYNYLEHADETPEKHLANYENSLVDRNLTGMYPFLELFTQFIKPTHCHTLCFPNLEGDFLTKVSDEFININPDFPMTKIEIEYNPPEIRKYNIVFVDTTHVMFPFTEEHEPMLLEDQRTCYEVIDINTDENMGYLRPIRADKNLRAYPHPVDEYIQIKTAIIKVPLRCCFKIIPKKGYVFQHQLMNKTKMRTAGGFLYQDETTEEKVYFKLDKHIPNFFSDEMIVKDTTIINSQYSGILNENLYFIRTNGRKWLLYKNGERPIELTNKLSNNPVNDLAKIPDISIHPILQTEKNTFNIVFQLISIFQGLIPSPDKIRELTSNNMEEGFIELRKIITKAILSAHAILYKTFQRENNIPSTQSLAFFTRIPIISAINDAINGLKFKKDYRTWMKLYEEAYNKLFNIYFTIRLIAFMNAELIHIRLMDNIDYIHNTLCLEGDVKGCEMIKDAKLNDFKEALKSNENINEEIKKVKDKTIGKSAIRKLLSNDYKEIDSLIGFFNRSRVIPFINGSKYDVNVYLETQQNECKNEAETFRKNVITNRYKNLREVFTFLINPKQIKKYLLTPYSKNQPSRINITLPSIEDMTHKNSFEKEVISRLQIPYYRGINNQSVVNTLKYLFFYRTKGVFVSIRNNVIKSFIPFFNDNYKNDWSHLLPRFMEDYNGRVGTFKNPNKDTYYGTKALYMMKKIRGFRKQNILDSIEKWASNGCLINNVYQRDKYRDGMLPELLHMFKVLCLEHRIPDVDFFVNVRDFPQLKKDKTTAEEHLLDSKTIPLIKYNYNQYAPILGFNTTDEHADIPIPNMDDWRRVMKLYFANQCNGYANIEITPDWNTRKPTAIFRGAATGCGTTIHNNQRIKLAYISKNWEKDENRKGLLDAGISTWAVRDKKKMGEPMRHVRPMTGDPELDDTPLTIPLELEEYVPMDRQIEYKYVIYVDGNAAAYRYQTLMDTGAAILKVESMYGYKMWFYEELKGYNITKDGDVDGHDHIIVDANLDNLENVLRWCRENDDKCKQIAENAGRKSKEMFGYHGCLEYMSNVLKAISKNNGRWTENPNVYNFEEEKARTTRDISRVGSTIRNTVRTNSLTDLESGLSEQILERKGVVPETIREEDEGEIIQSSPPSRIRISPDDNFEPIPRQRISRKRIPRRRIGQLVERKDRSILKNIEGMRFV
jgi:hypothetical protein